LSGIRDSGVNATAVTAAVGAGGFGNTFVAEGACGSEVGTFISLSTVCSELLRSAATGRERSSDGTRGCWSAADNVDGVATAGVE